MSNNNEHGNSGDAPGHNKSYDIVLNGTQVSVQEQKLTYELLVQLAYPGDPQGNPDLLYTVTYAYPKGEGHEGSLAAGQHINAKDGLVIYVRKTNRS